MKTKKQIQKELKDGIKIKKKTNMMEVNSYPKGLIDGYVKALEWVLSDEKTK